jgi:peptidoglycan/xylan/chitin deacetylase (PgdA/CDA1 family)
MPPARLLLYVATAGVLAVAGRAILVSPPPIGWAALMLVAYGSLLMGGVLRIRWRLFVDALVRGPRGARGVALTFDDGPDPRWTPRVLEVLAEHGATATFFVIGRKAEAHPEIVHTILAAGHSVGLHSYEHDWLFAIRSERRVRHDLERAMAVLESISGERPVLFRPPIGHTNPIIARVAEALDLSIVGWSIGARDGVGGVRPADVVARVRRDLRDGAIVLMHDAPERGDREPAAVRALPAVLDAIEAAGLEVQSVTKWLEPAAGLGAPSQSREPERPRESPASGRRQNDEKARAAGE